MLNHKKILIEDGPGLGDLVMITPVLVKIKELYPDSVISILTSTRSAPIIARLPFISHVYTMDRHKFLRHIRPMIHFFNQDYVILTTDQSTLAIGCWLLGVPHRAGVCKDKYKKYPFYNCQFPHGDTIRTSQLEIFRERVFQALSIDLSVKVKKEFYFSQPNEEEILSLKEKLSLEQFDSGQRYAAICPYGNSSNNLTEVQIENIVTYLTGKYNLSCIICDGTKREFSGLIGKIGKGKVVSLCGKINLMEMVALLQKATITVGNDSGPMHISCACRIPTVGIFSTDVPERWAVSDYCFPVSIHADCAPCKEKETCPFQKKCINGVPWKMIAEQIDLALSRINIMQKG